MARSEIRAYVPADRPSLIATINTVCAEGRWMETVQYEPTPAWEHALNKSDCTCHLLLVVVDEKRIVGWCRVFPDDASSAGLGIGLLSDYREKGLGIALVQNALEWARRRGLKRIHLRTRADNTRAIRMFQKFSFEFSGSTENGWMEMECCLINSKGQK